MRHTRCAEVPQLERSLAVPNAAYMQAVLVRCGLLEMNGMGSCSWPWLEAHDHVCQYQQHQQNLWILQMRSLGRKLWGHPVPMRQPQECNRN